MTKPEVFALPGTGSICFALTLWQPQLDIQLLSMIIRICFYKGKKLIMQGGRKEISIFPE